MPDCPYWRRLRTTPWTEAFRRSWDDDGVVGNKVYPSYLLLFDRGLSKMGSLDEKRSVSKRDSWSYDPEAVFGQCAGQWVVCLTCHHSISVLERKIISSPTRMGGNSKGPKGPWPPPFYKYQSFSGKILPHFLVFSIFVAQIMTKLGKFFNLSE